MPTDVQRVAQLLAEGKTMYQIAEEIEGPRDGPTDRERDEMARRAGLRGDSIAPGAEPQTPVNLRMMREFRELQAEGLSRRDAGAVAIHTLIAAAANGDPEAIYNKARWRARRDYTRQGGFSSE